MEQPAQTVVYKVLVGNDNLDGLKFKCLPIDHSCMKGIADRLAQLVGRRTSVREVSGSSPDRTNTQGLKITEDVLPL